MFQLCLADYLLLLCMFVLARQRLCFLCILIILGAWAYSTLFDILLATIDDEGEE